MRSSELMKLRKASCKNGQCRLFHFYDAIGYNTRIGMEGTGVSQGQRRLIARAIYKNSEYILFDETKNALDATNEWEIMNTLHEFYKGKTVVIATHRLGTIRNADQIVIMNDTAHITPMIPLVILRNSLTGAAYPPGEASPRCLCVFAVASQRCVIRPIPIHFPRPLPRRSEA